MSSVASQIRIDLIASAAQLKAGLRDGKQSLDSFADQVEAFDKRFRSRKSIAERMQTEQAAWQQAMQKDGSFLASAQKDFRPDMELRRHTRLKDSLPWGNSFRAELSKEAAATAAAIGDGKTEILQSLAEATKDLEGSGSGILGQAAGLISKVGPLGMTARIGAGLGAAFMHFGDEWATEQQARVRTAAKAAGVSGQRVEDASRISGAGVSQEAVTGFQRSLAERDPAFAALKLDPEKLAMQPLIEQLSTVSAAFAKINNPADRAKLAFDIFGKSAKELLPILTQLREKFDGVDKSQIVTAKQAAQVAAVDKTTKAKDTQWDKLKEGFWRSVGFDETTGMFGARTRARFYAEMADGSAAREQLEKQFAEQDASVKNADANERARVAAEALAQSQEKAKQAAKEQAEHMKAVAAASRDAAFAMSGRRGAAAGDRFGGDVQAFMRQIDEGRIDPDRLDVWEGATFSARAQRYGQQYRQRLERIDQQQHLREAEEAGRSPMEEYRANRARFAQLRDEALENTDTKQLARLHTADLLDRRKTAERLGLKDADADFASRMDDLREAAGTFSPDQIRRAERELADQFVAAATAAAQTPLEELRAARAAINTAVQSGAYSDADAGRKTEEANRAYRGKLGVRRPFEDFERAYQDLVDAQDAGEISPEEAARRRRELKRQAIGDATADMHTVSPAAALAQGSREAYALIAQTQLNDPKTQLAREANRKLDRIAENTRPRNQRQEAAPALDFN